MLTQWNLSPRAVPTIDALAIDTVSDELTLAISTAHQSGRIMLNSVVTEPGTAIVLVDEARLNQMAQDVELLRHSPEPCVRSSQKKCWPIVAAFAEQGVGLSTGRQPSYAILN